MYLFYYIAHETTLRQNEQVLQLVQWPDPGNFDGTPNVGITSLKLVSFLPE